MNEWLQLGLGGAALLILSVKQKADSKTMRQELQANRKQQEQMLKAVIEKDQSKDKDVDRLIEKIDKLVESNHEFSLSFIQSSTKEDANFNFYSTNFVEIKTLLGKIDEKHNKSLSKMHDRIDSMDIKLEVVKNNTDTRLKG